MSFVVNGKSYSGVSGDDYKKAAQELYNRGETLNLDRSCVDLLNQHYIQAELDKLEYTHGKIGKGY